ncbi:hypothetical protein ADUPG1_012290 [Aduncisulcus paluster]|uniref:Uncharacterized protein n=1 Tax=Aduncisulcus paluster TaxID=2918883 RepID=A0ABQ5JZ00_9EUKA|nr:hypothetical protein ADUPG1_012290 [Aduncisulcus paluster]
MSEQEIDGVIKMTKETRGIVEELIQLSRESSCLIHSIREELTKLNRFKIQAKECTEQLLRAREASEMYRFISSEVSYVVALAKKLPQKEKMSRIVLIFSNPQNDKQREQAPRLLRSMCSNILAISKALSRKHEDDIDYSVKDIVKRPFDKDSSVKQISCFADIDAKTQAIITKTSSLSSIQSYSIPSSVSALEEFKYLRNETYQAVNFLLHHISQFIDNWKSGTKLPITFINTAKDCLEEMQQAHKAVIAWT